jgi:hypothetical protein
MTYTNIASPYTTAGDPNANFNFNLGSWDRFQQGTSGFNKSQFKVALQQLQQAGVLDSSRGYANEKLKAEVLRGTPGIASDQNPLGQYQGTGGNFGLKSYEAAKAAGWAPQDIFDEIQSGRSGMVMPSGALHQYYNDLQIARDNEAASATATFRADLLAQQQSAAADQQRIQEEMAAQAARVKGSSPTGVGEAASIKGSRLSITESGGRKGTKRFARPTQYMNTLGMTSGGTGSAGKSPITP